MQPAGAPGNGARRDYGARTARDKPGNHRRHYRRHHGSCAVQRDPGTSSHHANFLRSLTMGLSAAFCLNTRCCVCPPSGCILTVMTDGTHSPSLLARVRASYSAVDSGSESEEEEEGDTGRAARRLDFDTTPGAYALVSRALGSHGVPRPCNRGEDHHYWGIVVRLAAGKAATGSDAGGECHGAHHRSTSTTTSVPITAWSVHFPAHGSLLI